MLMMKRGVMIALAILLAPVAARAMDQGKHDDIARILQITDARKNAQAMIDATLPQIMTIIGRANPEIPQSVLEEFRRDGSEEFTKALPEFVEAMTGIFDASYSTEEIKQLLAFYESPLGRKMIAQTPQIMQQSMALGQHWGNQVGARVVARIRESAKKKGYDL